MTKQPSKKKSQEGSRNAHRHKDTHIHTPRNPIKTHNQKFSMKKKMVKTFNREEKLKKG